MSPTEDKAAVWSDNFVGVYHLNEISDGTPDEFEYVSGNGNDGVGVGFPTQVDGKIGKAQDFDNTDDYVHVTGGMGTFSNLTLEAWVKRDSAELT